MESLRDGARGGTGSSESSLSKNQYNKGHNSYLYRVDIILKHLDENFVSAIGVTS